MSKNKKSASQIAPKNERAGMHNLKKVLEKLAERDAQDAADALEAEQGWTVANQYFARLKRIRSPSPPIPINSSPIGSPTGTLAMARVAKQPRMQSPFAIPQSMVARLDRVVQGTEPSTFAIPQFMAPPPLQPFGLPRISNFAPFSRSTAPMSASQDTARGGLGTQRKTTTGQVTGSSSRNPTGDARPQDAVVAARGSPGYRGGYTMGPQSPGAPYDYWQERDYVLQVELDRTFSQCSNEMIPAMYDGSISQN
ncbi:hypothetical protein MBLNU13_g06417t1 [Cladosporium sp. NU13]